MKIKLKVLEKNSVIEKTAYEDAVTGMDRPIYKIKGAPIIVDGLKISREVKYLSLSQITTGMYIKHKDTNDIYQFDAENARKRIERRLEKALKILGVDSYKDDLKTSYGSTAKYQFSEEDVPFLSELASRDIDGKNEDDLYWLAAGIYSCFCHKKDIDEDFLEDIGNTIQQKIGFTDLKFVVALKNRLESINSFSIALTQADKYSREEKVHIYEKMLNGIDALLQEWNNIQ